MDLDFKDTLPAPQFETPPKLLVVTGAQTDGTRQMVEAAQSELADLGARHEVVQLPDPGGMAPAIALAARMANFDGFIALADCEYVKIAPSVHEGLGLLAAQGLCLGQAVVSGDPAPGSARGAARTALHLIALARKWGGSKRAVGFTHEILMAGGTDEI